MQKVFEYAVGDVFLLNVGAGQTARYTVKSCAFREPDRKEIYTISIDGVSEEICTKNRLHYLIHHYMVKKLACGKYRKYTVPDSVYQIAIRTYYEGIREAEEKRVESIRDKLERDPQYREAKKKINALNFRIAKEEYYGKDTIKIFRMKQEQEEAKREQDAVLKKYGLDRNTLRRRIRCTACGDTGVVSGGYCLCVKENESEIRRIVEKLLKNG